MGERMVGSQAFVFDVDNGFTLTHKLAGRSITHCKSKWRNI